MYPASFQISSLGISTRFHKRSRWQGYCFIDTYYKQLTYKESEMAFNEETVKGKWLEIKGEVQKAWGKLTNDELDQTKGDSKAIAGLVLQKYGTAKEDFTNKFSQIVNRFETKKDQAVEGVKDSLKN